MADKPENPGSVQFLMRNGGRVDQRLLTRAFWQALVPGLNLSASFPPCSERFQFDDIEMAELVDSLRCEAFFVTRSLLSESLRIQMLTAVDQLIGHEIDPTWALMFDEFWAMYARFGDLLNKILGIDHRWVTGNYIFVVPGTDSASGWGVHRDLLYRRSLRPDGMPEIMSLWVAITDATPLNSCLYCLPASRDPNYPDNLPDRSIPRVEDVVCLPVLAGQVIGLNHALLHWGSRSSRRGPGRRVSLVFDIQRGDVPMYHEALLDPGSALSFEQRAAYIAHDVLWLRRYNVNFSPANLALAREMVRNYGGSIGLRPEFLIEYST